MNEPQENPELQSSPPSSEEDFDVVVIGGGPGGSTTAFHLVQRGYRVLVLERHAFPRYHIGESLTGIAATHIDAMGLRDDMARLAFPEKTGVKVVGRDAKSEFFVPALVRTWQVRRDAFDELLLQRAIAVGAVHRQGMVKEILREGTRVVGVVYRSHGPSPELVVVRARMVVDASGHAAVLSRHGVAGPRTIDAFGHQIGVFTQFEGAERDPGEMGNNTVIFYAKKHHWGWFIPLSSSVVSVGAVVPVATYKEVAKSPEALMSWAADHINPGLTTRLRGATRTEAVRAVRNYSYRISPYTGDGWLCVGDAHRFSDPVFSFGVAFAMSEAVAAANTIDQCLRGDDVASALARYVTYCDRGQAAAYDLIRYFWRYPAFFPYQVEAHENDMMRLFSGDFYATEEIGALTAMRESLRTFDNRAFVEPRARAVAERIYERYADFQGLEGAYLAEDDGALCLSLVLSSDDLSLYEHMYAIEAAVTGEFGRLAVRAYTRRPHSSGAELALVRHVGGRGLRPGIESAHRIFDRRSVQP